MTALHESWEYRDWPHPGYVCQGCGSDLTYDEAMSHRRCSPQLSGPSESTAPDHSRGGVSVETEQGGEAAPESPLPRVASDGRANPSASSTVDPVTHWPGKGGEPSGLSGRRSASVGDASPSASSLAEPSQRADNDGAGTENGEGLRSVPVSVVDLIPRLREAFPNGLPTRGSVGMLRDGEASR